MQPVRIMNYGKPDKLNFYDSLFPGCAIPAE